MFFPEPFSLSENWVLGAPCNDQGLVSLCSIYLVMTQKDWLIPSTPSRAITTEYLLAVCQWRHMFSVLILLLENSKNSNNSFILKWFIYFHFLKNLFWETTITIFIDNISCLKKTFMKKVFKVLFKKLYDPFLRMGFNCLKAVEPLRGGSLLRTTKFLEVLSTHLIDLGRLKGWVDLGATQWFWTRDPWIRIPAS